ncbi:MAG TPA: NADH-quinone oxidoreductase subunit N [Edaphocola sp.]|nr:NADH-quinone oxidoreductase subunit N [Edaphocola sp.]
MKPLIAAAVFGIIMMLSAVFLKEKKQASGLAILLLFLLLGVNIWALTESLQSGGVATFLFNDMLRFDPFSVWFNVILSGLALLYVLLNAKHIEVVGNHVAEYYALLFFILVGGNLLNAYNNLLILFLGIEIISIPQYILAGSDKRNLKSSEASLKYLLTGSFSTGIMLMGMALLFGAMGSFDISQFDFGADGGFNLMAIVGILFLVVSLSFKVSAAPMHFWTPDVYDGAPTTFTTIMATIVKSAVFVGFMRLFKDSFSSISPNWELVVAIITALTLLIGNITAVFQQSVKRMLAYSSIAQAGFMLFAILAVNARGMQGMVLYAVAYSVATIGMFTIVAKLRDYTYDGFNGLARREPFLAFTAAIFLLSLAGIPLTGGFFAKYYMLMSVMSQGGYLTWLVVFALLMAVVSVYYYFRVIWAMYFKAGEAELTVPVSNADRLLFGISAMIIIAIGVYPGLVMGWL